jgi:hypothetical protein
MPYLVLLFCYESKQISHKMVYFLLILVIDKVLRLLLTCRPLPQISGVVSGAVVGVVHK